MKVMIELDNDVFKGIKENNFDFARGVVRSFQATIADAIRNGKFIPDNATNGDVIKAMFPNVEVDGVSEDIVHLKDMWRNPLLFVQIPLTMWNAPYMKEVEE